MFDIILLSYLTYKNGARAKLKGQNPILWGFITTCAYLIAMVTGGMIVIFNFCKECVSMNQLSSADPGSRQEASKQLIAALSANQLHLVTIELFGVGGYLLVRYILDRKPDKKKPEVHWMDRMGENNNL
jgi:hypothetical protein